MLLYAFLAAAVCLQLVLRAEAQVVETEYGSVRGQTIPVFMNDGEYRITSFLGIPFARPPVGSLRFEPPQKHDNWTTEFVANTLPDQCMQSPLGVLILTHPLWFRFSEDCLTMSIFKPENPVGPLEVVVWFHGGGYTGGGNIQYPGHFLAARNVIVVVPNYRLGVFGFASTPDKTIRGNMGMLDQVMALQFVQDNIANFGGNRNRVTIFGQSAGASSAALHMISPLSEGLYHQAILESGADTNVWTLNFPGQEPDNYIFQVASNTNCMRNTTAEMIDCLRAVSPRDLRIADSIECTPGYFCQGFAPIVDGPGGFMPDHPNTLREALGEKSVPVIAGHCKDDGSLYTIYFIPEANDGGFTREEFQHLLRERLVGIFAPSVDSEEIVENAYQAMDWKYTPWPYIDDLDENREAFNKMITDGAFGYAMDRHAKLNAQHADTYTYLIAFRSLNATSFIPEWMGVPHNGELPYVWGYGYFLTNPLVRQQSQIVYDVVGWTPEDAVYADYVQTLWSNFAKYGNPTPTPVKAPFNDTMTTWPKYAFDDNLKNIWLDGEISIREQYRQSDYAFFTEYIPYVTNVPIKATSSSKKKFQFKTSQIQEQISRIATKFIQQHFPGEYEAIINHLESL